MAYAPDTRCRDCGAQIEFIFIPDTRRVMAFDPLTEDRSIDPLANYAIYREPRTGNEVAHKITDRDPLAPDEYRARPHWRTCPNRVPVYRREDAMAN